MNIDLVADGGGTYSCTINGIKYMRLSMDQAMALIREAESTAK
nr:MAG TPA: hypothetical protein [Caudoviricetes sp.]